MPKKAKPEGYLTFQIILVGDDCQDRKPQQIILVGETQSFRHVARRLPLRTGEDRVVEVGSSYGDTLFVLDKRSGGLALGLEKSAECVRATGGRFPQLAGRVRQCNCLTPEGAEMVRSAAEGAAAAFVDIGGDRHAEAVS